MSIYLKVFLVVFVGTVGGWFAIDHAIHSTDRMADTFTTSTTTHLSGREDDNKVDNMVILNSAETKSSIQTSSARDAIDASLTVVNGNSAQGGARGGLQNNQTSGADIIMPNIDSSLLASNEPLELDFENLERNEQKEEEEEEEVIIEEDEEDAEEIRAQDDDAEYERADSDSDMIQRGGNRTLNQDNKTNNSNKVNRKKPTQVTKVTKPAIQALDIAYALPAETTCVLPDNKYVRIGINYREGSYAIKGQSLSGIDQLIKIHRQCGGGKMLILQNDAGLENTDDRLIQLRQDEIKYYLLQRNIPKNDMIFPDSL